MKRENINYLLVGTFVLVTSVILMVVLYKITGRTGENDPYFVVYDNISGLKKGAPVTYEGFFIGHVEKITPTQNGKTRYRVDMKVRDDWVIPDDSVASIHTAGILAETAINITEGQSKIALAKGSEITGEVGGDMFAALGSVADDVKSLTKNSITPLLDNLNHLVGGLSGEFDTSLAPMFADLRSLAGELNMTAKELRGLLNEENKNRVSNILANVDKASTDISTMAGDLVATRNKLNELMDGANEMINENKSDVRSSTVAMRKTMETLSQHIDAILLDMESTSRNMNEFSRQIRHNPGLLISGTPAKEKGTAK